MKLVIHGGCGAREDQKTSFLQYHEALQQIINLAYVKLSQSNNAIETAIYTARILEDNPIFNAGTGSRIQQDGQIRMSASIMDSIHNKFAAVINIQDIQNPVDVAAKLMEQHNSILAGLEASNFAHNILKLPKYNPMTEHRFQEYLNLKQGYTGTIGVVALDNNGVICAITSTGGAGFEFPGRVGDSPTVAGNYASKIMGVSCTGIGEHIVNQAVAAKLHTRVCDGMKLEDAVTKTIAESNNLGDYVGLISLDQEGNIEVGSTDIAQTLYAFHDGIQSRTFYNSIK